MNGKPWTTEHAQMLKQLAGFAYDHEIAKATGHDVDTVQRRRSALGLPAYRGASRYSTYQAIPAMSLKAIKRACARVAA